MGKTTVAATLGLAASRLGLDTLLVEIEGKRGLASLFDEPGLVYADTELVDPAVKEGQAAGGRLRARTIRANDALVDYFEDHGLRRFGKALTKMQVLDTLATSTPGLKDLIVLGKIKQLEMAGAADLIIVDAPASGHAISFLRSAKGLQATIDTGPIRRQADEVVALLTDPARAQVLLVTLPEETPVNELIETAYAIEDEVGVRLGPAVVNGVYGAEDDTPTEVPVALLPELVAVDTDIATAAADAAAYWQRRANSQAEQIERLTEELPLEQLTLPRRFTTRIGRTDVSDLADLMLAQLETLRFDQ